MREDPESMLNKRSELVSKCRYKKKIILANIKWPFPYDMYCNWNRHMY